MDEVYYTPGVSDTSNGSEEVASRLALDALRRFGVKVEGFGCPTEYEASVAHAR